MSYKTIDDITLLEHVRSLLAEGKARDAVSHIHRHWTGSIPCRNALGVALMRAGDAVKAVDVFRGICVNESGVVVNQDLPLYCLTNFATALLLVGRVDGCVALLKSLQADSEPGVRRLRDVIERWRNSLGWIKRMAFDWYGADTDSPIPLDFEPGELGDAPGGALRPAA
ncbi:MAG: hypothetical protein KDA32_05425 [Phycisphaerales bacterium]|nr:hypothetical protein [Phycisphaerales bacterium]